MNPEPPSDADLYAQIDARDVREYLELTGWRRVDEQPERFAKYFLRRDDSGERFVVTVPLRPSLDDYGERIVDLVGTIASAERRPTEAIALTLVHGRNDTLSARLQGESFEDGSIDLVDGAAAFKSMKEMLLYAALAEREAKALFAPPGYAESKRLLAGACLAQTRRGSFVLSVVTRLPPLTPSLLPGVFPVQEPPQRRIMRRLARALEVARAAGQSRSQDAFREGVKDGLSANLCAALGRLGRDERLGGVSFCWQWSWTIAPPEGLAREVSFSPQLLRNVREGGEYLRETTPIDSYQLVGVVDALKAQGKDTSHVEVLEVHGGRAKRVHLTLSGADNDVAIAAYKSKALVYGIGRLEKTGGTVRLLSVRDFRIVAEGSPPEPT